MTISVLVSFGIRAAAAGLLAMLSAVAAMAEPSHGLSIFNDLKYKKGFAHFDYVNPDAPKGGRLSTVGTAARDTFDSFNAFIVKGNAAQGLIELVYDSLMTRAYDEPDAMYGLLAESADVAADKRSVTFKLRPEAKFADGTQVTADDCVFTFKALKEQGHPMYGSVLRNVEAATAIDPLTVRYTFRGDELRDLPSVVASMPVLPRAFYVKHPFGETWFEPPLGSGPYRVDSFSQGSYVSFARRPDYWAKDLNVGRGRFNFDEIRYTYFRARVLGAEAVRAGQLDLREEFTSKEWATGYDIPAVRDGRLLLKTLPDKNPSGTQGYFINTRRAKFADPRVRLALNYAFNFEWAGKHLFYGAYKRTGSFFENSDLKAVGPPSPTELALLEPFRGTLSPEIFHTAFLPPVSDGSEVDRKSMAEAAKLLNAAGFAMKDGKRFTAKGEPFEIEFMTQDASSERILGGYVANLLRLGIVATIRQVDEAQYLKREKEFDFDILGARFSMQITPGPELKNFFGSAAANHEGSFNLAGINSPAVDALIADVAKASSRAELETAARALDRVLRGGHYWISNWYKAAHTIVFWNKYGWPERRPDYDPGIIDTWWFDKAKAAKLATN